MLLLHVYTCTHTKLNINSSTLCNFDKWWYWATSQEAMQIFKWLYGGQQVSKWRPDYKLLVGQQWSDESKTGDALAEMPHCLQHLLNISAALSHNSAYQTLSTGWLKGLACLSWGVRMLGWQFLTNTALQTSHAACSTVTEDLRALSLFWHLLVSLSGSALFQASFSLWCDTQCFSESKLCTFISSQIFSCVTVALVVLPYAKSQFS